MRTAIWLVAGGLAGCDMGMGDRRGLVGDWTLALSCDAATDAVPGCEGEMSSAVRLWDQDAPGAELSDGEHRTLFPGYVAPDGSYAGVSGPVLLSWASGDLVLELVASGDDPLASTEDAEAWSGHRLLLVGTPGERCWEGRWSWTADDGAVVAEGPFDGGRRRRDCD